MAHPEFWSFAWKSILWFGAAYLASAVLHRRSASARHVFWTCVLAASLLLPMLIWFGPGVQAPLQMLAAPPLAPVVEYSAAIPRSEAFSFPRATEFPWTAIWLTGVLILLGRLAIGHARLHWMFRNAVPLRGREGVRIVRSDATDLPLTFGVFRSIIVLPADWDTWTQEARQSVLIHETAHAKRRDSLWTVLANIAAILHWFNPLAWVAMSAFRREQERSCDDAVVREGVDGAAYAAQLVELARTANPAIRPALGVTDRFDLEGRVKALLDPARRRGAVSRKAAGVIAAAALLLMMPLGLIRAQAGMASITGSVADPSGGVIANAQIELKSPDGTLVMSSRADAIGSFTLRPIPPGSYELEIGSSGFKKARANVTLTPGAATQFNTKLAVGETAESVRIVGGDAPRASSAGQPRERIRVGGNLQAPRLLNRVDPVYPADVQAEAIESTVSFRAVITTTGTLVNAVPLGNPDSRLVQAGQDALRLWHYSPALLNGLPVESVTTVSFTFQLRR